MAQAGARVQPVSGHGTGPPVPVAANWRRTSGLHHHMPTRSVCAEARRKQMRVPVLAALAGVGLSVLALPAAAVPAGPVAGVSSPPDMLTNVRMKRHRVRRHSMSGIQRRYPGASFVRNKTPGAAAGSGGGNGVTGSYAAPSGR